ncbi:hypothetical protein Q8G41_29035, partial [Klebsiella pneumoniae]|uniref:hypothetical protein n=1 Tax=Klebsiella pneumoniae TaxID=573 RepID=UPI0030132FD6
EALLRLGQIAASRPATVTWVVIGGWPAFQREYREPVPVPGDHFVRPETSFPQQGNPKDRIALHTSTVIAVEDAIVRLE